MQFLLLLSALLSAVTGAFVGPRAVAEQVSQSEAQVLSAASQPARVAAPAVRPAQARASSITVSAGLRVETPARAIAAAPLTDIRLNE